MSPDAPGRLIVVIGPSGAGKDSLIGYARDRLGAAEGLHFARRVVTRDARAEAEDHLSVSPAAFAEAEAAGRFCVTWRAHGLRYAIPVAALEAMRRGDVTILNGSRAALPEVRAVFGALLAVHVTARPEVLAARLARRGREGEAGILARLRRAAPAPPPGADVMEIANNGPLGEAGERFVAVIVRACAVARAGRRAGGPQDGRASGGLTLPR